ncbi:hypothetical protein STSP_62880 [Streptomyces jeddahensis]|uniref:Uncharacterized protein n=1 Tax=Streptomyces jeddahensis TaxID=1716141 RepID=A0A177HIF5_9ACTN|nr:hypothetical protein STSP_62880 [Streptomyces jeddahensis]
MRALDLAEPYPLCGHVRRRSNHGLDTGRKGLPVVLVIDAEGLPLHRPRLPAHTAVHVPLEQPLLVAVVHEQHDDAEVAERLTGLTVAE